MKDLKKRLFLSMVVVPSVFCILFFAFNVWFQYAVALAVALLTCVAVWEYEQFVKAKGGRLVMRAIILFTLLEVFSFFISAQNPSFAGLPLTIFFAAFLFVFILHFKENEGAIVNIAVSSFGLTYIVVPMGMILGILYSSKGEDGRWWVAYLLTVTKIADAGAYFGGNLWGKTKLAPKISPGKTVEGTFVGLLCACVASFVFYWISASSLSVRFTLSPLEALLFGLVLGLIGPLGDLSESLLKRDANKKDSNALPGLGGVLDMVDSLLFNAPILFIYLYFVKG